MDLFLAQSDTTAGFLSRDKNKILFAKKSPMNKRILKEVCSIATIKEDSRIPKIIKKAIRRKHKTTFIFQNKKSFRVIYESIHLAFLKQFKILYSSSANLNGEEFSYSFAFECADVVVFDKRLITQKQSSSIYKIKKTKIKKIRQ